MVRGGSVGGVEGEVGEAAVVLVLLELLELLVLVLGALVLNTCSLSEASSGSQWRRRPRGTTRRARA